MKQVRLIGLFSWIALGMLVSQLVGCGERSREQALSEEAVPSLRVFDVRGAVREYEPGSKTIVIQHEEIPGYMRAMKMPFEARDPDVFDGLIPGHVVRFKLHVVPDDSWVDSFEIEGAEPGSEASGELAEAPRQPVLNDPTGVSFYKEVPELSVGEVLPSYGLTNEFGVAFQLDQYRGKVVALTFIFTRCPLPNFCPRMSQRFQEAQELLQSDPEVPLNWQLLSVSFDPNFDTPNVLRSYGRRYRYDTNHWSLATGAFEDLVPLGIHFGLYFSRDVTPDNLNHNLRTVVLDPEGRVAAILIGNEWTAQDLVTAMKEAF